jgi:hypothetical protein
MLWSLDEATLTRQIERIGDSTFESVTRNSPIKMIDTIAKNILSLQIT